MGGPPATPSIDREGRAGNRYLSSTPWLGERSADADGVEQDQPSRVVDRVRDDTWIQPAGVLVEPGEHQRQHEDGRLQIGALLENLKSQTQYLDRIIIKADGRITFLSTRDIDWIEADDKYVHLHTGKTARMVRQTLSGMETQLDPQKFLRIHRSAIVNIERIKELQPLFNGEQAVILHDGTRLTLTRNYKDRLFELLGKPL